MQENSAMSVLLIIDIVIAGICGLKLMRAKTGDAERGTNCVTRFMRDVNSNVMYSQVMMLSGAATLLMFIIGSIKGCFWVCLPTLIPIGLSFFLKMQSNKNTQRVKDARVVTKTTGKVVAATGDAVATTAAFAAGGPAAAAAAHAVASGATRALDKCMDQMDDVDSPDISKEDFKELNAYTKAYTGIDIEHPEEFIAAANRAGIPTEGRDLREIADNVIRFAPTTTLEALPDNLSIEEKAMRIMKGAVV